MDAQAGCAVLALENHSYSGRAFESNPARCQTRAPLRAADVRGRVRWLLDEGFDVKVPPGTLLPLRLPARGRER